MAVGLRELLRGPVRGPLLATLWPQFCDQLTVRLPAGGEDLHAQARELLADCGIPVPSAFTPAGLRQLRAAADPRQKAAAAGV